MSLWNPEKLRLSSVYGVFRGARGGGRIHTAAHREGYDNLILQALRIKLRYPLGCPDIDCWIDRLVLERYRTMYYFTDLFDPNAVTLRKSDLPD
jgi:hypothetical protein